MRKSVLFAGVVVGLGSMSSIAAADGYARVGYAPAAWSWTGFYVGVQGGSGWGTSELNEKSVNFCNAAVPGFCAFPGGSSLVPNSAIASYGLNGWHGGGTVGY